MNIWDDQGLRYLGCRTIYGLSYYLLLINPGLKQIWLWKYHHEKDNLLIPHKVRCLWRSCALFKIYKVRDYLHAKQAVHWYMVRPCTQCCTYIYFGVGKFSARGPNIEICTKLNKSAVNELYTAVLECVYTGCHSCRSTVPVGSTRVPYVLQYQVQPLRLPGFCTGLTGNLHWNHMRSDLKNKKALNRWPRARVVQL